MTRLKETLHRSLPFRLSIWIVAFCALIFLAAHTYQYFLTRSAIRREAVERATQVLEQSVLRVDSILEDAEIAANNLDWLVYRNLDNPDAMPDLARNTVLNNPSLNGCSISFEPGYYKKKGRYYSIYAGMGRGSVTTVQEGSDDYQYFYMDWYQLPKLLGQPCWTEPYVDYTPQTDESPGRITSYCVPLTSDDGSFVGCLSLDISLAWMSEQLSPVTAYPHSYALMLGRGGTYLVHPDTTRLLSQTIFTETLAEPNPDLTGLGHAMVNGEEGMRRLKLDGQMKYVFFQPLKTTGWSVAVVCPEREIFVGYNRLRGMMAVIVLVGLLLMLLVCTRVVSRELDPLRRLATQAETIASGRFDQTLPEPRRADEIGLLTRSFSDMQASLRTYIRELTETTAARERIEGELRIARDIQMGMLPRTFPPFPTRQDIDLYAGMKPAREVGGDLYDFVIHGEKLYFCVGDVSGKGVPASLLMAVARNLFRVVSQEELLPADIAARINDTVSSDNDQLMFITMFIGRVDLGTGRLEFCNCGHNPPAWLDASGARFLHVEPNTPLGVCPGWEFVGEHLDDIRERPLLLYTDGLNEAENCDHEQYGNDRMLAEAGRLPFTSAEELVARLHRSVTEFVGGAEQSDDLTILCLRLRK